MNLNTKQQTLQYNTIPDGSDDDVVVVVLEHQQEKSTGRSYSVLGGLVLLLVAVAMVVLHQGGGGRPSDPAGSRLVEGVYGTPPPGMGSLLVIDPSNPAGSRLEEWCAGFVKPCPFGCCGATCCDAGGVYDGTPPTSAAEGLVLASLTTLRNDAEEKGCVKPCGYGNPSPYDCCGGGYLLLVDCGRYLRYRVLPSSSSIIPDRRRRRRKRKRQNATTILAS